jgi:hypothetical protein
MSNQRENRRIKILPFPNSEISEDFHTQIKNSSASISANESLSQSGLLDELSMIAEFKDGNKRLLRGNIVTNNCGEKFISVSPHPIHIYLDTVLENYYKSEQIKNNSFINCAKKANKKMGDVMLLDIDTDSTHHCYNEFIKCKMNSIVMLTTAMEGFFNSLMPNNYIYITSTGKQKDRDWSQNKARLEADKIDNMIPEFIGEGDYWTVRSDERKKITEIYKLRNDLIHLKSEGINHIENYSKVIKNVIGINLYDYITSIINTLNDLYKKKTGEMFITFSEEAYTHEIDVNKIDFDFISLYLTLKGIQMSSYFKKSKSKIKTWESNGIPKEYIDLFISQEGGNINQIIFMLNSKYSD